MYSSKKLFFFALFVFFLGLFLYSWLFGDIVEGADVNLATGSKGKMRKAKRAPVHKTKEKRLNKKRIRSLADLK
jgi:hypothetical protein